MLSAATSRRRRSRALCKYVEKLQGAATLCGTPRTMSLLDWLGHPAPKAMDPRSLSPIRAVTTPERTVLGVLGTRSSVRYEDMETQVLAPVLEAWGIPDELVLPAEGESSFVLQAWAERQGIPVRLVSPEWIRHGRRAGILRDAIIQRDATHFVLLQGPRSNALSTLARRLIRKKRAVVISERPGEVVKTPAG